MNDNSTPIAKEEFTAETFDEEVLLYSKSSTQAVYLNDTAHAVWLLCKEQMTVGQMIHYLQGVYPEQKDQIRNDVISALKTLHTSGVITFQDEA